MVAADALHVYTLQDEALTRVRELRFLDEFDYLTLDWRVISIRNDGERVGVVRGDATYFFEGDAPMDKVCERLELSPNFEYGLYEQVSTITLIHTRTQNRFKILSSVDRDPNHSFYFFFTPDSKIFALKVNGDFHLFRCSNGEFICLLSASHIAFGLNTGRGGSRVCETILDLQTRKSMCWGLKALIALSRDSLHLFRADFTDEELAGKEVEVIGGPAPALFLGLLNNEGRERPEWIEMLMKYTVYPQGYNILHWLSQNQPEALAGALAGGRKRYFAIFESPLYLMDESCAGPLLAYVTGYADLLSNIDLRSLVKIIEIPSILPLISTH